MCCIKGGSGDANGFHGGIIVAVILASGIC